MIHRLNFSDAGDYDGDAWLMNGTDEPVSLSLQPSAMNDYYAVQAIKAVTKDQLSNLELNETERDCIDIIKAAADFVDCRRKLTNQRIDQFWNVINQIMAKLQEKNYLSDDCQWKMPAVRNEGEEEEEEEDTMMDAHGESRLMMDETMAPNEDGDAEDEISEAEGLEDIDNH